MTKSMTFIFIVFFSLLLIVLAGGHFLIYYSVIKFFNLTAIKARLVLGMTLFILAASFLLSSIFSRILENSFSRIFYFISGLWLGTAATLLSAFTLLWIIVLVFKQLNWQVNFMVLGAAAIALSLIYSAYGVYNAYHPVVKEITVKIRNLPAEWKGKKAVQLTDVHLGQILGVNFLQKVIEQTNAQNPDIVFITGDLFDGLDGNLKEIVGPIRDIKAPWGIYYITGNHETYLGVDNALAALKPTQVEVLDDQMVNINGMQIIGISYPDRGFQKNIGEVIKNLNGFNSQKPSILLWHSPTNIEQAKDMGIGLQLSGHTHKGQIIPVKFISRLIYGKYYAGLHTKGDYSVYTSAGIGVWGPTMRTGNRPEIAVINFE